MEGLLSKEFSTNDVDLQLNLGFKLKKNTVFPDVDFHLKSGFNKILCSHILVVTLILVSQKYCVHQYFIYNIHTDGHSQEKTGLI